MELNVRKKMEAPAPETPVMQEPSQTEPVEVDHLEETLVHKFYSYRVLVGLAIAFFGFWILADWTGFTAARMQPGQIVYSNQMVQLWTAAYRLVFVVAVAIAIVRLTLPAFVRYWRQDVDPLLDAGKDFLKLAPQQRLWFSFAVLAFLCYLFVMLLSVKLPESLSVGP